MPLDWWFAGQNEEEMTGRIAVGIVDMAADHVAFLEHRQKAAANMVEVACTSAASAWVDKTVAEHHTLAADTMVLVDTFVVVAP